MLTALSLCASLAAGPAAAQEDESKLYMVDMRMEVELPERWTVPRWGDWYLDAVDTAKTTQAHVEFTNYQVPPSKDSVKAWSGMAADRQRDQGHERVEMVRAEVAEVDGEPVADIEMSYRYEGSTDAVYYQRSFMTDGRTIHLSTAAHKRNARKAEEALRTWREALKPKSPAQDLDALSKEVVTEAGFDRGRQVLVGKCITCHDMRTILAKPRTAKGWMNVNERMLEKPAVFGDALDPEDVPYVTAYLVAITPDIQRSAKSRREDAREKEARADALLEAIHDADTVLEVDKAAGEALLQAKCLDCHEMEETEAHGGDDASGWRSVIAAMVDEGAELTEEEINLLAAYLEVKFPKSAETKAAEAKKEAEDEAAAEAEAKKEAEEAAAEEAETEAEAEDEEEEEAPKPKPKKKAKPEPKGDRKAGKAVYMKKCKACHGDDGKGDTIFGSKINVASLSRTRLSFSKVRQITAKGVSGTKMKGYEGKLSDEELDNVAAFVKSLR